MERNHSTVKSTRRYDSSRRREHALHNRDRILEVARRLLLARGYTGTTISSVAEGANVSVETIYKSFGGKSGLVRAIWERGLKGAGPIPAEDRSDEMQAAETDPRVILRNWGTLTTEVAPLVAPILLLVRSAASIDPDMAVLRDEVDRARLTRMERNARGLFERGTLREGVSVEHARDVLWAYSSPELYELLVLRQGWPLTLYGQFIADAMATALLPEPTDKKQH